MEVFKVKSLRNVERVIVNASPLISSAFSCLLFFFFNNSLSSLGCLPKEVRGVDFTRICAFCFPSALCQKGLLCPQFQQVLPSSCPSPPLLLESDLRRPPYPWQGSPSISFHTFALVACLGRTYAAAAGNCFYSFICIVSPTVTHL